MRPAAWAWEALAAPGGSQALVTFLEAGGSPHELLELPPSARPRAADEDAPPAVGSLLHAAASLGHGEAVRLLLARAGPHAALTQSSAGDAPRDVPASVALLSLELLPSGELRHAVPFACVRPLPAGGADGALGVFAPPADSPAGRYRAEAEAFARLRATAHPAASQPERAWRAGDMCELLGARPTAADGARSEPPARWVRARIREVWARDDAGVQDALAAARRAALAGTAGTAPRGAASAEGAARAGRGAGALAAADSAWRATWLGSSEVQATIAAAGERAAGAPDGSGADGAAHEARVAALSLRWAHGALSRGEARALRAPAAPLGAGRRTAPPPLRDSAPLSLPLLRVLPLRQLAEAVASMRAALAAGVRGEGLCPPCLPPPSDPRFRTTAAERMPAGALLLFVAHRGAHGAAAGGPHDLRLAEAALECGRALAAAAAVGPAPSAAAAAGGGSDEAEEEWRLDDSPVFLWLDSICLPPPAPSARAQAARADGPAGRAGPGAHELALWAMALGCADALALVPTPPAGGGGERGGQWALLEAATFLTQSSAQQQRLDGEARRWVMLPSERRAAAPAVALESGAVHSAPRLGALSRFLRLRGAAAAQAQPAAVGERERPLHLEEIAAAELLPRAVAGTRALGGWPHDEGSASRLGTHERPRAMAGQGAAQPPPRIGAQHLGAAAQDWPHVRAARPLHAPIGAGPRAAGLAAAGPEGLPTFGHGLFAAERRAVASVQHPNARRWFAQHAPPPRSTMWRPAGRAPLDPAPLHTGR